MISCLGLLGLVIFSAVQQIKEIGIRKVLGASLLQIFGSFAENVLKLILIAFLVTARFSWIVMRKWLQDLAYRIPPAPWIFFLAGAVCAAIALLTVSVHAMKVSVANPVKNLRTE